MFPFANRYLIVVQGTVCPRDSRGYVVLGLFAWTVHTAQDKVLDPGAKPG